MSWWPWSKPHLESDSVRGSVVSEDPERLKIQVDFTLGLGHRPGLPVTHVVEPIRLDDALMPGVSLLGRFMHAKPSEVVWVIRGVPQPPRRYDDLVGLKAHVFLTPTQSDPDWEKALERVYRAAVLASRDHEFHRINWRTPLALLRRLVTKGKLDDEEQEFQQALERASLFPLLDPHPEGPVDVTLAALRKAERIYLADYGCDREQLNRVKAAGAICLPHHELVKKVLEAYGLTWYGEGELEDAALGAARIVSSKLREQAVAVDFASARWHGERLEFAIYQNQPLVLDFAEGLVSGPTGESSVTFPFSTLTRVDVDERELKGENKVHRFFYLHLSDGSTSLVFEQRIKEYYEHSPLLRELGQEQELATHIIHAIPAALGVEPRLARPDLVPKRTLRQLTGKA